MSRAATVLLTLGVLLFVGVLASQDLGDVLALLARAGFGLVLVALFHLLPLLVDALALAMLFGNGLTRASVRTALLSRWVGEAANSLMPAGQLGGPVLTVRYLARRCMPLQEAAAAVTVNTTMQTFAQIMFALVGVLLLGAQAGHLSDQAVRTSALLASGFLGAQVAGFYWLQRRGMFAKLMGFLNRFAGKRDWSSVMSRAAAIDQAVQATHNRGGPVAACLLLNLIGWFIGTGEVYLICLFLEMPVSLGNALLLESVGSAIRGAAFAIPGALGVQEGGYLLLAALIGLPPHGGLALSLAKRVRELMFGLPGLLYLHFATRPTPR